MFVTIQYHSEKTGFASNKHEYLQLKTNSLIRQDLFFSMLVQLILSNTAKIWDGSWDFKCSQALLFKNIYFNNIITIQKRDYVKMSIVMVCIY